MNKDMNYMVLDSVKYYGKIRYECLGKDEGFILDCVVGEWFLVKGIVEIDYSEVIFVKFVKVNFSF